MVDGTMTARRRTLKLVLASIASIALGFAVSEGAGLTEFLWQH